MKLSSSIQLALIGKTLQHSRSPEIFRRIWAREGLTGIYDLLEWENVNMFPEFAKNHPEYIGFNVTIPYKKEILAFVNQKSDSVLRIGACNTLVREFDGSFSAHNTDYLALRAVLGKMISDPLSVRNILIIGTGGTAATAKAVAEDLFPAGELTFLSRNPDSGRLTYDNLKENPESMKDFQLLIQTTPVGMYPNGNEFPDLPYEYIEKRTFAFDAVYNPEDSLFLQKCREAGAVTLGGWSMLEGQAEAAWEIWKRNLNF